MVLLVFGKRAVYCRVTAPNPTCIRPFTSESVLPLDNPRRPSRVITFDAGRFPFEAGHLERKIGQILVTEDIRALSIQCKGWRREQTRDVVQRS